VGAGGRRTAAERRRRCPSDSHGRGAPALAEHASKGIATRSRDAPFVPGSQGGNTARGRAGLVNVCMGCQCMGPLGWPWLWLQVVPPSAMASAASQGAPSLGLPTPSHASTCTSRVRCDRTDPLQCSTHCTLGHHWVGLRGASVAVSMAAGTPQRSSHVAVHLRVSQPIRELSCPWGCWSQRRRSFIWGVQLSSVGLAWGSPAVWCAVQLD